MQKQSFGSFHASTTFECSPHVIIIFFAHRLAKSHEWVKCSIHLNLVHQWRAQTAAGTLSHWRFMYSAVSCRSTRCWWAERTRSVRQKNNAEEHSEYIKTHKYLQMFCEHAAPTLLKNAASDANRCFFWMLEPNGKRTDKHARRWMVKTKKKHYCAWWGLGERWSACYLHKILNLAHESTLREGFIYVYGLATWFIYEATWLRCRDVDGEGCDCERTKKICQ